VGGRLCEVVLACVMSMLDPVRSVLGCVRLVLGRC